MSCARYRASAAAAALVRSTASAASSAVAEYQGDTGEFLPILEAARWTGVGRHCVWGNGEILPDPALTVSWRTHSDSCVPRPHSWGRYPGRHEGTGCLPRRAGARVIDHPESHIVSPTEAKMRVLDVGVCGTDREIVTSSTARRPTVSTTSSLGTNP